MHHAIATLDWIVIGTYLVLLIAFALWLARGQSNREDYYVAGREMGAWPIAISIMATQCSTNSILGAPAFVAFAAGGGLVWLQYELALPFAMIVLMFIFMPTFNRLKLISVYSYLERRFDSKTRRLVAGLFLFVRAVATAVTVYSIAIVTDLISGIGFFWSVVLLGVFTVIYDAIGGIKGVVYSDVLQMCILVSVLALLLFMLVEGAGGFRAMLEALEPERRRTIDFSHHGFGDGNTFAFWPMLIGGFFLYISYYGCDQSQVQRELCAKNIQETNKALFINGLLRFPLVALYCLVGVGIAVYATGSPDFISKLPQTDGSPNYNLAVPLYILTQLPAGLIGLALVALFAAAMSSLDSVLNSLSATTMEDFVRPFVGEGWLSDHELATSRLITLCWGALTLSMAFFVGDIAPTVLEAINKIGSLANGPILAVFTLGLLVPRSTGTSVCLGLLAGILVNVCLWLFAPQVSWLWWNVTGFLVTGLVSTASVTLLNGLVTDFSPKEHLIPYRGQKDGGTTGATAYSLLLTLWGVLLLCVLLWLQGG